MNKEEFLRRAGRRLPRRVRQEVLRDLREMFQAAEEAGESEETVLERLGTPEEFAAPFRKKRRRLLPLVLLALGAAGAAVGALLWAMIPSGYPEGVIGGADGPTVIMVTGSGDFPGPGALLLGVGLLLCIAAAVLLYRERRSHGEDR